MWRTCPLCHGTYDDTLVEHFCRAKANVSAPVMLTCPNCYESYPASTIHICNSKPPTTPNPVAKEPTQNWNWIMWLLGIVFLLGFCGRQPSEQKPQQQQNQKSSNIPVLVKTIV